MGLSEYSKNLTGHTHVNLQAHLEEFLIRSEYVTFIMKLVCVRY